VNNNLRLRPYKPCDAEKIATWITSDISFYQWSAGRMGDAPLTVEKLKNHYEEYADNADMWVMTCTDENNVPVGQLIMHYADETRQTVRLGFIVVDPAMRGKGYGKRMVKLAATYAMVFLASKSVSLGVFENNPGARNCYRSIGFREIGESTYTLMGEEWRCIKMEL